MDGASSDPVGSASVIPHGDLNLFAELTTNQVLDDPGTGRNVQLSVKASKETVDAFYAVTEAQPGWVLGYTLQRAIEALQRELKRST